MLALCQPLIPWEVGGIQIIKARSRHRRRCTRHCTWHCNRRCTLRWKRWWTTNSTDKQLSQCPWWVQLKNWFQDRWWRKAWSPQLYHCASGRPKNFPVTGALQICVIRTVDTSNEKLTVDLEAKVEATTGECTRNFTCSAGCWRTKDQLA